MLSCVLSDPTCFSFRNAVGLLCVFSHMMSVLRPVQFPDYLASQLYGEAHETVYRGAVWSLSSVLIPAVARLSSLPPVGCYPPCGFQVPSSLGRLEPAAGGTFAMTHAHWLGPHLNHTRDLLVGIEDGMMICFIRQLRK